MIGTYFLPDLLRHLSVLLNFNSDTGKLMNTVVRITNIRYTSNDVKKPRRQSKEGLNLKEH